MRKLAASLASLRCSTAHVALSNFRAMGVCELPKAPFQRDFYRRMCSVYTSVHHLALISGILIKVLSRTIEPLQDF